MDAEQKRMTDTEVIDVRPQPGPQLMALESKADIIIYGGAAGGGKSWLLVHEPLRWVTDYPGFRGGIFRRTYPQLKGQGGIWDECQSVYRGCDAHLREGQELDATFPSGANIAFLHLQHEKTKYEYMGHQFCYLGFDELTHFTETQFFYMLSRNRSTCGVKPYVIATCNPEPGWVADFLAWWIDPELGTAIPERSGVLRYFVRVGDDLCWADSKEALIAKFPEYEPDDILSVTFIEASLSDNEILQRKDPGYRAKLMALSKIERDRLLGRNWKVAEGSQIDESWIHRYTHNAAEFEFMFQGHLYKLPISRTRRIATIDTAGTSKEKAAVQRGTREPSWSICAVWDTLELWQTKVDGIDVRLTELLFLRHVWRQQVDWNQLRQGINGELETWNVTKAYIENAHFGQALACEVRACPVELIGPVIEGMGDHGEDAKLERAIASGMLARFEQGKIFIPRADAPWIQAWLKEVRAWTGKPNEVADQIDTISYAAYVSRKQAMVWGGTLPHSPTTFRSAEHGQGFRQVATRTNLRS
jgi:hypothetical protein